MRGNAIAIALVALAGCSFSGRSKGDNGAAIDASASPDVGVVGTIDAAPDGPAAVRPLYAVAGVTLYRIDVGASSATKVGDIGVGQNPVDTIDGLAFDGTNLVALDGNGMNLLTIDPATAQITDSTAMVLVGLGGLTVIPAGDTSNVDPILLAAAGGSLYHVTPDGQVTTVGGFTSGATFHTDLAWVHGHGLYITLDDGQGTINLAQIRSSDGHILSVLHDGYDNILGLSGYQDKLWALSSDGTVNSVDFASGVLTPKLMSGPSYSEAAE